MKYRWQIAPDLESKAKRLALEARISPLLAQILIQRNLGNPLHATNFLRPKLQQLADPFLLPQMSLAVDRLMQAHARAEPLVIFGDYDVDGVTSTALLLEVFRDLGWSAQSYLPHRLDEGYGLSADAVQNCLNKFPTKLLLAVDCGSTSTKVISDLKEQGIDVIVLDHHQVADPRPPAVALVNPHLASSGEPSFRELCSAGLAFKLAHALVKRGREIGLSAASTYDLKPHLEWVALGTVADLVPLTGENRILVSMGLGRLRDTHRIGLKALKEVAGCPGDVGTYEIGFQLGPRLNAAGRMENAEEALQMLISNHAAHAGQLAQSLDARNRERQEVEKKITESAVQRIRKSFNPDSDYVIVEGDEPWHIGVVGIVASRVLQEFYRPTIILGGDNGGWRGSGRSIEGFDLASALRECHGILDRHGGHAMAAGVSLQTGNLAELRTKLNALARSKLNKEQLQPPLRIDASVELRQLTPDILAELDLLKPTGMGNPAVQLCARGLMMQRPPVTMGSDGKHLKFWVNDGFKTGEVVWWNGAKSVPPKGKFDLAFVPQINSYMGRETLQLKMLDWQTSSS